MEEAVEICKLRLFLKLVAQVESQDRIEPLPDIDFNIRPGNTLSATHDMTMYSGRQVEVRFWRCHGPNRRQGQGSGFSRRMFRKQQTELDGTVTAEDKAALRRRFSDLEEELSDHLSGEYGVKKSDVKKWTESHKPFHWFCDFHRIISGGGFDVIIGNPPYVVFPSEKVPYKFPPGLFESESSKNLYGLTWERSLALLACGGHAGLIVQLTLMSSERMKVIQDLLLHRGHLVWRFVPKAP